MPKSELFSALNDVNFADYDPDTIESEIISLYESISGRTLSRSDPVKLFLNCIILALIQQRNLIDKSAKNNLLAYAAGDYLDHIGAMLGVSRLEASHAMTTAQFTLSQPQNFTVIIPAGTRITPDSKIYFSVMENCEIASGNHSVTCECICTQSGEIGNGFIPGQINKLVDVFPYEMSVVNITESSGGTDTENDENFRERIQIAPESFTTAGSVNAYKYFARTAHSDIIDVAVITPPEISPGHVDIYPLMTGGALPSDEIINSVYQACNAENIRPDTDYVTVKKPEIVIYDVNIKYYVSENNSGSSHVIQNSVNSAVNNYVLWQKSALGRDINPDKLKADVIASGAKRCVITSPEFTVISSKQVSHARNITITYGGIEEA